MRPAARPRIAYALIALLFAACGGDPAGPTTGALTVLVSGLPGGAPAAIAVSGPDGFSQNLTGGITLPELATGEYTITASAITVAGSGYAPTPGSQTIAVPGSDTGQATVAYALSTGSLQIVVTGLPAGTAAAVTVTGPAGFSQAVNASTTLTGLAPGDYTLAAAEVAGASGTFAPGPPSQTVAVAAAITPSSATVTYTPEPGRLAVTITGLPAGVAAGVTVTAPGYSQTVAATTTLPNLAAGSYTVTAAGVQGGGKSYGPAQATQIVAVAAGATGDVTVTYTELAQTTLNLRIDGMYLVQSTQTFTGTVPLVATRDALLRVFVVANRPNSVSPAVRARLYDNDLLIGTFNLTASGSATPASSKEASLNSSWNANIPGSLIRPGIQLEAEVDPDEAIAESNEGDNTFPLAGSRIALDVRTVPPFAVALVPVRQSNGAVGGAGSSNKSEFTALAQRMHPLATVDAVVHATFDVDTTISSADGDAWTRVLSEIEMLRVTEGTGQYYYGVVNADYCDTGGLAGIGYVGVPSAVGWDCLAGGSAGSVAAHEWGHNWGRQHSPCGGAADPDPRYPYAGGRVGVFGYDQSAEVVEDTSFADIMGYCSPQWISDYTYQGILDFRGTFASRAGTATLAQPCLVVWGQIVNGRAVLEPAFRVVTRPVLPFRAGDQVIEGLATDGSSLFRLSFHPAQVADLPGRVSAFAFAIPLTDARAAALASIRLGGGAGAEMVAPAQADRRDVPAAPLEARREAGGRVVVRYEDAGVRAALIRDGDTGELLAVAHRGIGGVTTSARELEVVLSNGVHSETRRVRVEP